MTSIHQPNSDVLIQFDHIYVLSTGGHCVFDGHRDQIKEHLSLCQIPCLEWQTPIEVLIKISSKKLDVRYFMT